MFKSITGQIINDPNVCVRGSSFACLCAACEGDKMERITLIMAGGTPDGVTEENARVWQSIMEDLSE